MLRQNIRELDAHAAGCCKAGRFRPHDEGIDGHGFSIAGQLNVYGNRAINRQLLKRGNERAGGAQVGYSGVLADGGVLAMIPRLICLRLLRLFSSMSDPFVDRASLALSQVLFYLLFSSIKAASFS
jgi:hypothetical protein